MAETCKRSMNKKRILLFGGTGLIGTRIQQLLDTYTVIAPKREEVNLEDPYVVEKVVSEADCDVVVYAAGVTNQDFAENNREYTLKINAEIVKYITKETSAKSIPLIYFSTDAVFKGNRLNKPYSETDHIDPINYYGLTKAKGEEVVLNASSKNLILRLVSVYTSSYPQKVDFARRILHDLSQNAACFGITDQYFNPTFSDNAVYGLSRAIEKKISGILHVAARDCISNYNLARRIARKFNYDDKLILPISFHEFFQEKAAKRAQFSCLGTDYSQKILSNYVFRSNSENIDIFYKQYSNTKQL